VLSAEETHTKLIVFISPQSGL